MSLRIIFGLVVLCGARRALADRAVRVAVAPSVPFDEVELTSALQLRLPDGAPVVVAVAPIAGGVRVTVGAEVREVALDGLRGPEAARLVALATTDLFDDDLASAPTLGSPALAAVRSVPAVAPRPASYAVEMLGTAAAWDRVLAGGSVGIAVPRGRWIAAAELGGGALISAPFGLRGAALRTGGGPRFDWIVLRAELIIAPVFMTSGTGDRTVLFGAGASARLRVPITTRIRGVIGVGVDGYANRTIYQLGGVPTGTTPWVAPWLAAGVEVAP